MGAINSKPSDYLDESNVPQVIETLNKNEPKLDNNNNNNDVELINDHLDPKSLRFHEVRGKNLITSNKYPTKIERSEAHFCNAIAFSNRPVGVFERVYVKILKLSSIWNGTIRFGFTNVDPNSMRKSNLNGIPQASNNSNNDEFISDEEDDYPFALPKYVYPNLTNKKGYWAGAMSDGTLKENDVLYFYLNSNGEIHYGINNTYSGLFLNGVDVFYNKRVRQLQPLWAIFDIYGNTLSIELITKKDHPTSISLTNSKLTPPTTNQFKTFVSSSTSSDTSNNTNSLGSIVSNSSTSSCNSSITLSSNNSTGITVIPNPRFTENRNNQSQDENIDNLLISCRRLCVDNHLNETLHNSIIENSSSDTSNLILNELNNNPIQNFYSTIPILIHDNNNNNLSTSTVLNRNDEYKFMSEIHGKHVKISQPDCLIAYRESSLIHLKERYVSSVLNQQQCSSSSSSNLNRIDSRLSNNFTPENKSGRAAAKNCYIFFDRPIEKGRFFCLQIVGIDQNSNESNSSLSIGCTTCNPASLNPKNDLPDDSNDLLDRPEYWVTFKNIFNNIPLSLADELCFKLDERSGNLNFYINGSLITECLFNADVTQNLWFFFDLCGKTNAIRIIPSCNSLANSQLGQQAVVMRSNLNSNDSKRKRPSSALINYYKNQLIIASNASASSNETTLQTPSQKIISRNSDSKKSEQTCVQNQKQKSTIQYEGQEECKICWSAPIECVFYSCGHMCLCWNCATMLKKESTIKSLSTTLILNDTVTNTQSTTMIQSSSKSKNPICPICRLEIIDIIRFFKP